MAVQALATALPSFLFRLLGQCPPIETINHCRVVPRVIAARCFSLPCRGTPLSDQCFSTP